MTGARQGLRRATQTCVAASIVGLLGCGGGPPAGVTERRVDDPSTFYPRSGYTQLVPPIHLPSSASDIDQVEIWMKLPEDGQIQTVGDGERPLLRFPPGTIVDRVEFEGRGEARRIADVRGASIAADGTRLFHVYRPSGPTATDPLLGLEWAADDPATAAAATEHFLATLRERWPAKGMGAEARDRFLGAVRRMNRCAPCHQPNRPPNRVANEFGIVNRGTDANGFVTPSTILWDEVPLENAYGRFDHSMTDAAIEIRCDGVVVEGRDLVERRCPSRQVPTGSWNWQAARTDNPQRAAAVCSGRKYLIDHLAQEDRGRFSVSAQKCETTYQQNL